MNQKLYRSRKDKVIAGVCGGLAEYLGLDPTMIRLLWAVSIFVAGTGLLLYIIAAIIIPERPRGLASEVPVVNDDSDEDFQEDEEGRHKPAQHSDSGRLFGIIAIAIGVVLLLERFSWFSMAYMFPALLILLGVYILGNRKG